MTNFFANKRSGFTLVEMIVSAAIFAAMSVVAVGALISTVDANRRARSLTEATNNLNFVLQNMVREMRTGYRYGCDADDPEATGDCNAGSEFGFRNTQNKEIGYYLSNNRIYKDDPNGDQPITPTAVDINQLEFQVTGTQNNDQQSRVLILIGGQAGEGDAANTFRLQTTASKRLLYGQ